MTIEATVIEHTQHSSGELEDELITFVLKYPRIIHSEFMTHRQFSRNASSSRAIPAIKGIQNIRDDVAMPVRFGANQKGMQDKGDDHTKGVPLPFLRWLPFVKVSPNTLWRVGALFSRELARSYNSGGYHKQVVNRVMEPYSHISVVVTMTRESLYHFLSLRDHPDADPTIAALAVEMKKALRVSFVRLTNTSFEGRYNNWHLPFIKPIERHSNEHTLFDLIRMSCARCARVSYLNHDNQVPKKHNDTALYDRLAKATPPHLSPLEHQACVDDDFLQPEFNGNLPGWIQYRKLFEVTEQSDDAMRETLGAFE
jgi:thymidylate synthase ThyX